MRYILYTDGSCLSNPDGPGGYAAVLIQNNKEIQRTSGGNPSTTNNRMEITAVLEGLRMIPEGAEVLLKSDSEYVIKTIQGVYSVGKNADLWQQLGCEIKKRCITCEWVRGHNGNAWNELCDELAGEAAVNSARGYRGGNRPDFAAKTGAMGVQIEKVNASHRLRYTREEYAAKQQVRPMCASGLASFYTKSKHTFKDYAALKTGGIDVWSRTPTGVLEEEAGTEVASAIRTYFENKSEYESALRWYMRGLDAEDAVRKIMVSREIQQNAVKSHRSGWQPR